MSSNKIWKKILLIIIAFALVGSSTYFFLFNDFKKNPKEWQAFAPENQRFNINFPKEPQKENKEMEIADKTIEYQEIKSEIKDILYSVSYIDFPSKWRWLGANTLLTKTYTYMMESESNIETIKESELTTFKGMPVLKYSFIKEGKEVHGRLILSGNTFYRLTVTQPQQLADVVHVNEFFDTFSLKDN